MTEPEKSRVFTLDGASILRVLKTPVDLFPPFDPTKQEEPPHKRFDAIWDTGATNTVITKKVVSACGLVPTGIADVETPAGKTRANTYLVNIRLLTGAGFVGVAVTEGKIKGAEVLIGMDIITKGDFVITNYQGKTVFTFRTPSLEAINFLENPTARFNAPSVGRNSPCPCGSKKKYKACHGK